MRKFDMVIYHGNCADGFTAAWIAHQVLGDEGVEYVPGFYGKEPPDVAGKHVLMVDFSYKNEVIRDLIDPAGDSEAGAKSITILDHHKSAQKDLEEFMGENGHPDVDVFFDMAQSGAKMAWDYFHPEEVSPRLVRFVQDRDLWQFHLDGSREVAAWLFSFEYDFDTWSQCAAELEIPEGLREAIASGKSINRKHDKDIRELLAVNTFEVVIQGHRVKVANLPYTMASDAAHILAEGRPFGACFFIRADGKYIWSFRSTDEGVDVSEIAVSFGGGGHARAAGCQTSMMFPRYHDAETDAA